MAEEEPKSRYTGLPNLGIDRRATTEIHNRAWLDALNVKFEVDKIVKRSGFELMNILEEHAVAIQEIKSPEGLPRIVIIEQDEDDNSPVGTISVFLWDYDDYDYTSGHPADKTFANYPGSSDFMQGAHYAADNGYYFSSGHGRLLKYVPETSLALAASDAPAAKFVHSFAERIIVGRTREGDDIGDYRPEDYHPWRVRWCVNGDPGDWTGVGSGAVDLKDTPGIITGITSILDQLVVYKEDSIIHGFRTGSASAPFRFTTRYEGVGAKYPHTLASAGAMDFFVGADDIYMYDGFRYTPISTDAQTGRSIRKEFFYEANHYLNKQPLYGFVVRELGEYRIIRGIKQGKTVSTNIETWIYNYVNKTWTKQGVASNLHIIFASSRHRSDGRTSLLFCIYRGIIVEMLSNFHWDNVFANPDLRDNIDIELESGDYLSQVDPNNMIELTGLHVIYESAEPAPVLKFQETTDRAACWGPIDNLELHSGGIPNYKYLDLRNLNRPTIGQSVRFKFTETSQSMLSILDLWPEFIERGPAHE